MYDCVLQIDNNLEWIPTHVYTVTFINISWWNHIPQGFYPEINSKKKPIVSQKKSTERNPPTDCCYSRTFVKTSTSKVLFTFSMRRFHWEWEKQLWVFLPTTRTSDGEARNFVGLRIQAPPRSRPMGSCRPPLWPLKGRFVRTPEGALGVTVKQQSNILDTFAHKNKGKTCW